MIPFMLAGVILGFSAGIAPGPLLTLVISETLRHNLKAGIKIALAPMITDLPIVIATLAVLAKLADFQTVLGLISLCGGVFIANLALENFRASRPTIGAVKLGIIKEKSLQKGVIVNFLSPHPYLFWLSVGAPTTVKAMGHSPLAAAAFIGGFYTLLVGSKIAIAVIVGRSRAVLSAKAYRCIMRGLGVALLILAGVIVFDGIRMLGG
jgi:threonine/homoserine/homoserine lactone efflux protein